MYLYPDISRISIDIRLQTTDKNQRSSVSIYDITGRLVRALECINRVDAVTRSQHSIVWDGRDEKGIPAGTGIYLYRLRAGDFTQTRKMIRIQ